MYPDLTSEQKLRQKLCIKKGSFFLFLFFIPHCFVLKKHCLLTLHASTGGPGFLQVKKFTFRPAYRIEKMQTNKLKGKLKLIIRSLNKSIFQQATDVISF